MHKRRSGSSTTIDLATFRGRDLQSASEAARAAMGDHAMILRVVASRDGFSPSVEIVAANGGDIERFRARLESPPLSPRPASEIARPLVIALVGPSGAGKSTTLAKLATHRHGFAAWKVGYLTLDTFRMGALAELRGYAEIAGLPLEVAYDEDEVDEALGRLADCDVVLVDTPGRGAVGKERTARWAPLLQRARPDEVHFVLPATVRPDAAASARAAVRGLGVTHLLVTKLDEVQEDLGLADLALQLQLPTRWVADGQEISGSLHLAPSRIVTALAALADAPDLRITA